MKSSLIVSASLLRLSALPLHFLLHFPLVPIVLASSPPDYGPEAEREVHHAGEESSEIERGASAWTKRWASEEISAEEGEVELASGRRDSMIERSKEIMGCRLANEPNDRELNEREANGTPERRIAKLTIERKEGVI